MTRTFYTGLIKEIAPSYNLDPDVVEAVVMQESSGQADAFRFEPKFYARYLSKKAEWAGQNPRRISSSYGLMQLMFVVAKEIGFTGEPEELFIPRTNLQWGCRKLASLKQWAEGFGASPAATLFSYLAAYNGGRADNDPNHKPMLRNGVYAASVLRIKAQLA